jgi:hypothetical protein
MAYSDMEKHLAMHRLADAISAQMMSMAGCVDDAWELGLKKELMTMRKTLQVMHDKLEEMHKAHAGVGIPH